MGMAIADTDFLYPLSPIDDHYQSFDDAVRTDVDRKERGKEGVLHPSNSYYHYHEK
jgi:hypothetical protein